MNLILILTKGPTVIKLMITIPEQLEEIVITVMKVYQLILWQGMDVLQEEDRILEW